MALEDFDPTSRFDIDTIMRALGGFSESPATARETALRGQAQEQDLGLDLMRRIQDLQVGGQERLLSAQTGAQKELAGFKAGFDPLAMLTQGVGQQGLSLEGPLMSNLMQIISSRYGANLFGRQATADAAGQRQKMALMQNVMADYQRQLAKLDPNDPNYETQVQALDSILNRRLSMVGGGEAAGAGDPLSMLRSMMGAPGAQPGSLPAGSAAPAGFEGFPLEFLQGDIYRSATEGAQSDQQAAIERAIADMFSSSTLSP